MEKKDHPHLAQVHNEKLTTWSCLTQHVGWVRPDHPQGIARSHFSCDLMLLITHNRKAK